MYTPLRAHGDESDNSSVREFKTQTNMFEMMLRDQKPLGLLRSHLLQGVGGGAGKPVKGIESTQRSSFIKDEDTQAAQNKLRQNEAQGLIKVEVDEHYSEEESSNVAMPESVEQMMLHTQPVGLPVSSEQPLNLKIISCRNGSNVEVPDAVLDDDMQH